MRVFIESQSVTRHNQSNCKITFYTNILYKALLQLSVDSNFVNTLAYISTLCDWLRNLAPLYQPIRLVTTKLVVTLVLVL